MVGIIYLTTVKRYLFLQLALSFISIDQSGPLDFPVISPPNDHTSCIISFPFDFFKAPDLFSSPIVLRVLHKALNVFPCGQEASRRTIDQYFTFEEFEIGRINLSLWSSGADLLVKEGQWREIARSALHLPKDVVFMGTFTPVKGPMLNRAANATSHSLNDVDLICVGLCLVQMKLWCEMWLDIDL